MVVLFGKHMPEATVQDGLKDVVALESTICFIDGREGRLLYRGYDIRDLAEHATFEEVAYLLWYGDLPTRSQLSELHTQLVALRAIPEELHALCSRFPVSVSVMDALRTVVSALALFETKETRPGPDSLQGALRLTAALPTILSIIYQRKIGRPNLPVRTDLSFVAYLLYSITGRVPDPTATRAMEVALILHADHELNASTFAARVTASTLSDLYSAVTSAIGTLKGPLHGGANERVMDFLRQIGTVDRVDAHVREKLAKREKIMGFGHRVYKIEDPRATILRIWSRRLGQEKGILHWYDLLQQMEQVVFREKGLYPNVDLYSGSVYTLLDIPDALFTPIFAVSRITGWTAHILEEYTNLHLIRPMAAYVGPTRRKYVPINERSEDSAHATRVPS